jgi:two-component system response regulator
MNQEIEVLLIEDNASDAEMIQRALKINNADTPLWHVKDGAEALDFLFGQGKYEGRQIKSVPKVILIDLKMPKVNGKECLMRIKMNERTKKIPVVVLSSSKEYPDIAECYDLGANGYVVKPVDFDEMQKAIAGVGAYWLNVNHGPH